MLQLTVVNHLLKYGLKLLNFMILFHFNGGLNATTDGGKSCVKVWTETVEFHEIISFQLMNLSSVSTTQ
jgi:hypothetical protein